MIRNVPGAADGVRVHVVLVRVPFLNRVSGHRFTQVRHMVGYIAKLVLAVRYCSGGEQAGVNRKVYVLERRVLDGRLRNVGRHANRGISVDEHGVHRAIRNHGRSGDVRATRRVDLGVRR